MNEGDPLLAAGFARSDTRPPHRRARRLVAVLAAVAVFSTTAAPPSQAGPSDELGGLLGGLLDPILDPILGAVSHALRPVTGLISDLTGLPVADAVDDLVSGTVDGLLGTIDTVVLPDGGAPLGPPAFEDLFGIIPLEPADSLLEDVVYPGVIEPTGPIVGPVVGIGGVATAPLGLDEIVDTAIGQVRDVALEPLGLDPAAYVIRATTPQGEVTRNALIDVPMPVDVTGDGADDITVELRILTAQPSLRVTRLPSAPASLPLAVEAILAPGGYAAPERLAVGYDALDSDAPGIFRATVSDLGLDSGELTVDLHSVSPGPTVALTAALYDQGPAATRVEPTDVRIGFTPVPADATITAAGLEGGTTSGRVRLQVSEPSRVDAAIRTTSANGDTTEVGAVVDRVPGEIDLAVSQTSGEGVALDYTASGPVDEVGLRLAQTEGGVTRSATVGFEGVHATSASFTVAADDLSYTASAPIDAITVEVIDPRGIIDRATVLRARLAGLPAGLDVDLDEGGAISLDAGGGELGLLELQLASDPALDIALPTGTDGIVFRDLPDVYAAFLRVTTLRSLTLVPAPDLAATLRTAGGQPFVASIAQGDGTDVDELDARLSALPAEVTVALADGAAGTTLSYDGSSVVDLLEVDVRQGGLDAALLVEQLPTSLDVTLGDAGITWAASDAVPLVTAEISGAAAVFGRATSVRARLTDVPTDFSIGLAGGAVALDAPGGIGLVEVLATDGTTEVGVPEGIDGLVLQDTPAGFGAALRLTGLRGLGFSTDPLSLELDTLGDRVFEVAVTQGAHDGSGADIRATIDRLPASVRLGLADLGGAPTLTYAGSAPVDTLLTSIETTRPGGGATTIGLEVHGLPEELSITLGEEAISYSASAVVPSLSLEVTDPDGLLGRAHRLLVALTDLPTDFTVGITGQSVAFDAGTGTLGSLEALLTNGPELALPDGVDGLLLIDEPTDFVAAVRIVGLSAISFGLDDAASFSLRTAGGRLFEVDVRQLSTDGSRTTLRATLDRLPSEVSLALGGALAGGEGGTVALDYTASSVMDELRADLSSETPGESPTTASVRILDLPTALSLGVQADGAIAYAASSRVPELSLDLADPGGIFGGATSLRLRALDLPTGITAAVDEAGGLSATTTGGAIGSLEALFTSGDEVGLDPGIDGIVFRDTDELFAAFVRITGLTGIEFAPTDGGAHLALDTDGGRVFVVDALTEDPAAGTRTAISATLDQLADSVDLDLADDPTTGLALTYAASAPMDRLAGQLELTDPDGTTSFDLEVLGLPTTVTFALDSATGALRYTGSDRVQQLAVLGENPAGIFETATSLGAVLEDLPTELEILLGGEGAAAISLDAKGGQLGLLEVLATSGPNLAPAPGVDGVVLRDTADDFVLGLRVNALRKIVVQPDPVAFTIGTAGGATFVIDALLDGGQVIDLGEGAVELQATFATLPSLVTLGFGLDGGSQALSIDASASIADVGFSLVQTPTAGTPLTAAIAIEGVPTSLQLAIDVTGAVSYAASAAVPRLEVDAHDPAGLFNRADKLSLRLTGLPTGLEVALSESGSVDISTSGGRLGQLEALAYLHTPAALAATHDGVVIEDLTNDYRVFARFTNINEASVSQIPLPRVRLVGQGGRPLSIGLYESAPGKPGPMPGVAFTTASLVNAPPTIDLALLPGDPGTINVAYTASATASSLGFQTNSGDRWITSATISNPVPRSFRACQTGNAACVGGSLGQTTANTGSFAFNANQVTTLNVLDCARPLTASCTASGGTQVTSVENLRVKDFQFAADINQGSVQASGRIYANTVPPGEAFNSTNAEVLSGRIYNRDGSTKLNFTFGNGFKAWDRYRRFDRFPSLPFFGTRFFDTRGGISCGSGTNLSVTVNFVFDLTFNATSLLGC